MISTTQSKRGATSMDAIKKNKAKVKRMKSIDEFRVKMDELLEEFSDLSLEDIADELDYRASEYQSKANRSI